VGCSGGKRVKGGRSYRRVKGVVGGLFGGGGGKKEKKKKPELWVWEVAGGFFHRKRDKGESLEENRTLGGKNRKGGVHLGGSQKNRLQKHERGLMQLEKKKKKKKSRAQAVRHYE